MTTPDRDRSLEQWLRQTPIPVGEGEHCLDAETLAAWAEGAIDGPARAMAEAHAANCGRCQAMLAVMARTVPAPSPATGTFLQKWMMMLGPAVAAAAAVALWFAVDNRSSQSVPPSTNEIAGPVSPAPAGTAKPAPAQESSAVSSRDALVPSDDEKRLADARTTAPQSALSKDQDVRPDLLASEALGRDSERRRVTPASPAPAAAAPAQLPPSSMADARALETLSAGNRTGQVNAPSPGPPPQQINQANQSVNQGQFRQSGNQSQAGQAQNAARLEEAKEVDKKVATAPERPAAVQGRVAAVTEKPVLPGAKPTAPDMASKSAAAAAAASVDARADALDSSATRLFEAIAPDKSAQWRVAAGRVVQQSTDGGASWTNQYNLTEGMELTAGGSASREVCWFVGRAGAIVVTTNGHTWRTLRFPETIDLVSVDVTDARSARVTTADGRVFSTTDGGASWTRR